MDEVTTAEQQSDAPPTGFFQKWFHMYFSPEKAFSAIDEKPDWILPVTIVALLSALILVLIFPIMHQFQLEHLMSLKNLSQPEAEQLLAKGASVQKIVMPISTLIMVFVTQIVVAFFFYLAGSVFLGGMVPYVKVLSMWAYTSLAVGIVAMIIRVPVILAKKTLAVQTSLAAFLSPDSKGTLLYKLLSSFDLFILWQLVLMTIGFTVIYKFSTKKSATLVFGLWAIWVVISVLLRSLFKAPGLGT